MIHHALAEELRTGIHALALQTTPANKWTDPSSPPLAEDSPKCLGGMKREMQSKEGLKE